MNVYKEMNDTIKDIYSKSDDFQNQYVLAWIEQLEKENKQLKEELQAWEDGRVIIEELE